MIIQSDRDPKYLDARIEKFMQSMKDFIQSMSEEEFETNKQGLVAKRLEKPKKLIWWTTITKVRLTMTFFNNYYI